MKVIFRLCLLLLAPFASFAISRTDSLSEQLNLAIKNASVYDANKLKVINTLKRLLNQSSLGDVNNQYNICLKLYEEYKYYKFDSSMIYAEKLHDLALARNSISLLTDAKLKVIFLMLSSGMFKETFDALNGINIKDAPDSVKAEYYSLTARAYYNLADFNNDNLYTPTYNNRANLYLDSALALHSSNSFDYFYYLALKFLKKGNPESALFNLHKVIANRSLDFHQIALATSTIGGIYINQGLIDSAKPYLLEASIADIKSSTKETLALLNLASIVYKEGDLEQALIDIEKANADATFYNARLRKVQVGAILPLIQGEMIHTIKSQKKKLLASILVLSLLVLLLAAFAIIIRKQLKKLKVTRAKLYEAHLKQQQINQELEEVNELKEKYNKQLKETNDQLLEANEVKEKFNKQLQEKNFQLVEANQIKEEYIGYFFDLETQFLSRFDKFVNSLEKKLRERKWEDIKSILDNVDTKKEKEEILKNFDKAFLRLFPGFVTQFNTLFKEEDKIKLKDGQLLNTDLRIFALIRLGIIENEKIANILDYSINTIYAKKTKIRSKTIINKDDLEKKIIEITTLSV